MSLLVESIKILNGKCYHLSLHEARMNKSRLEIFNHSKKIDLKSQIMIPKLFTQGLIKCRVIYDDQIRNITFEPYQIRKINSAKIVTAKNVMYEHKWNERPILDDLYQQKGSCDEILIINDGFVTDAYYYNLVFEKNGVFYTPQSPLLKGIQRTHLLKQKKIQTIDILANEIIQYNAIYFINALTPLGKIVLTPNQIKW